jgi:hypothetical protein
MDFQTAADTASQQPCQNHVSRQTSWLRLAGSVFVLFLFYASSKIEFMIIIPRNGAKGAKAWTIIHDLLRTSVITLSCMRTKKDISSGKQRGYLVRTTEAAEHMAMHAVDVLRA